ncbi:MAG: acyl-CoA dehydrogenase family protein [Chitinophagales bacterium]|nr:acyl-CoA dehydrogenase family protein [Chitinophagales bacterium]
MPTVASKRALKGGEFLLRQTPANDIFIPEEWSEEQRLIGQTMEEYIVREIHPRLDEIDSMKDIGLMPRILEEAGELGLLGTSIPEEYGGFGMNFNTTMYVAEKSGMGFSFGTTLGAHTGIGTLPILYYGNEEQKAKYLPGLASGKTKVSYCLTEPGAGSDANSGKTKAVLSADGSHYLITGQKMWITNGGFADIFIVFAKIDDDKNLSAFIVEKGFGGVTLGPEEKKLGIKGSSTVQVFFNNCPVPIANLLSKRGNGFKIALNILNIGRIKLAAAVIGGAKMCIGQTIQYAKDRKQFEKPIAEFGAIQFKLAEMAIRLYACESASYRAGQNIDDEYDALVANGMDSSEAKLKSVEQFAIECALVKVHGSEMLDYVVDEALQIHGGMGFSAEMHIEKGYRDARITRIYEGTNEINRMLAVGTLFKKAFKDKEIDITSPIKKVPLALFTQIFTNPGGGAFAKEKSTLENLKKLCLLVAGRAAQKYKLGLTDEQEILMNISDMMIELYVAESTVLRTEKAMGLAGADEEQLRHQESMARVYVYEAANRIYKAAKDAILSYTTGFEQRMMLRVAKQFSKTNKINPRNLRRDIAQYMIAEGKYPF